MKISGAKQTTLYCIQIYVPSVHTHNLVEIENMTRKWRELCCKDCISHDLFENGGNFMDLWGLVGMFSELSVKILSELKCSLTCQKAHGELVYYTISYCRDQAMTKYSILQFPALHYLSTPILTHIFQGKHFQAISATQLLKMDTRTTEILSFKKIFRGLFEINRFKVFPLVNFTWKKG